MKKQSVLLHLILLPLCGAIPFAPLFAGETMDTKRLANTVILDDTAVQNLRLETVMAEERLFETTLFAVGRVEEIPSRRYSVSSRIPGRVIELNAFPGDRVSKGQILVKVESRQPGNPPPTISLEAVKDGLVVDTHVLNGQPVEPDTDLLDIADRSVMWAVAKIPEQETAGVHPGSKARIVIPALGAAPIEAALIRYGVMADARAGTVEGVFEIPNPDGRLLPGMRAEFSIILRSRPNVLAVPKSAVQGDPTRRVLYIKDFELPNAFIRAPVVLGEENDRFIEVLNGLFPGDEVVTRGSYSLGFAGAGSGISLKEALDAAHGHEHNEDGSDVTGDQKTAEQRDAHSDRGHEHGDHRGLLFYAVAITVLALYLGQRLLHHRAEPKND